MQYQRLQKNQWKCLKKAGQLRQNSPSSFFTKSQIFIRLPYRRLITMSTIMNFLEAVIFSLIKHLVAVCSIPLVTISGFQFGYWDNYSFLKTYSVSESLRGRGRSINYNREGKHERFHSKVWSLFFLHKCTAFMFHSMEHHYENSRSQNNECMSMQVGTEVQRNKKRHNFLLLSTS